jgi:hypothetical protein
MSDPLEGLARKAARESFFLSSLLEAFARSEELDDAGLARALGCSVQSLPLLRLCRAPRHGAEEFRNDIDCIAGKFGVDPLRLAEAVKHGRVVQRLLEQAGPGFLMAARDRETPEEP